MPRVAGGRGVEQLGESDLFWRDLYDGAPFGVDRTTT